MNPVCPCGSSRPFTECCGPVLAGTPALTAETLMRSRYTAFTLGNVEYLEATNSAEAAKGFDRAELEASLPDTEWLGLEIRGTRDGGVSDATGMVRFAATYRYKGRQVVQVETSEFVRAGSATDGRWLYDRGEMAIDKPQPHRVVQIGRNDPCPCGSGTKYKKCCGK